MNEPFALSKRVAEVTGLGLLVHREVTGSTNADLIKFAEVGHETNMVLVTDHQLAGKGRLDRTWHDKIRQSLLVSFLLPLQAIDAALAVAALSTAARQAVDQTTEPKVLLKWPNDLVVEEATKVKKLGGVLAHYLTKPSPTVIIGVGINISAIDEPADTTSLAQCGMAMISGVDDRDLLLAAILVIFAQNLAQPQRVMEQMRAHSATVGKQVRVEMVDNSVTLGQAIGITDTGHLQVRCDDGVVETIISGDVRHLRRQLASKDTS